MFVGGANPNGICPLCEERATVQPSQGRDAEIVNCDRCGYYEIAAGTLSGFEAQRHLISGITRRSSMAIPQAATRPKLNNDNLSELLTAAGTSKDLPDQLDITLEYAKEHQPRGEQSGRASARNRGEPELPGIRYSTTDT